MALRLMTPEWLAKNWQITFAVETMTAMRIPRQDHVIARPYARHAASNLLYDTSALVAEHNRHRISQRALNDLEVGVAQAACADTHQNVTGLQRLHLEFVDLEWFTDFVQYRRPESHLFQFPTVSGSATSKQNRMIFET